MGIWDCNGKEFLEACIGAGGLLAGMETRRERGLKTARDGKLCACGKPIDTRSSRCYGCRNTYRANSKREQNLARFHKRKAEGKPASG